MLRIFRGNVMATGSEALGDNCLQIVPSHSEPAAKIIPENV